MNRFLMFILKRAKYAKGIAYLIATIGAAASYGTQVELLKRYELGNFSYVIPATIDLLAICAAIGLTIPQLPEKDQKYIKRVLTIAVLVSVVANMAGGHNWVSRIGHAWPVIAYLLAEGIANRLSIFAARIESEQSDSSVPQPGTSLPVQASASVSKSTAARKPKQMSAKSRILELASATPRPTDEEIAEQVGTKPGWVKHVIKTQ